MRAAPALLSLLASAPLAGTAFATIDYRVTLVGADAPAQSLKVQMTFDAKGRTVVKMPKWAPGAYVYSNPARSVSDVSASSLGTAGRRLTVERVGENGWAIDARGPVVLTYSVPTAVSDGSVHYSGPATYLYVDGRKEERTRLTLDVPKAYDVAVGLVPRRDDRHYEAPDYDTLADNPVTMGAFLKDAYMVRGKLHIVAMRGKAKSDVDRARLVKACRFVTETEGDLFGGLPYDRYVWHFNVNDRPDGAGGLEHLSSTEISLASGVGPRAVSVLAHEFFHLWNVKRIRSAPLGPFDYDTLPQTGALWWLEGVTDYYAHTLLPRYGWWTKEDLYRDVAGNLRSVRARPERLKVSPYDASFRVRDAANGRGNSNGFGVSYYDTGWLVGMILDLAIIDGSNGRESLDSVEKTLWSDYRRNPKRGFAEGRIGELVARYGGREAGALYDSVVNRPGELPVEAALARAGLGLREVETTTPRIVGLPLTPNLDAGTAVVGSPPPGRNAPSEGTPADASGAPAGTKVESVNGVSLAGKTYRAQADAIAAALKTLKIGEKAKVVILLTTGGIDSRTEEFLDVVGRTTRSVQVVETLNPTKRQLEVRRLWMSKHRPGTAPR